MSTKTRRRPPTDAERAERRAAEREQMREAVEALRTSEGWQRWLNVRRHFHTYSFHNQLLIATQCPEATRVAGFRRWLELGYCVRKGEKAIRIWAPCPPSKKELARWREAGANSDDEPRPYFRLAAVFDASQVSPLPEFPGDPVPLKPPSEPIAGDAIADRVPPLVEFADSLELEVSIEEVPGAALGYHEPATGRIVVEDVRPDFSANAQVSVLVHELAHALVRIDRREGDPKLGYAEEEVVVECVVFWRDRSIRGSGAGRSVGDGCHRRRCRDARPARSASPTVARLRRAVGVAEGPRGAGPDRGGDDDGCQEETDRGRA